MSEYTIQLLWDDEAEVWIAINDKIPLALESDSLDKLIERMKLAAPEIIEMNNLEWGNGLNFVYHWHEETATA